jgi:hypothetical protein
MAAGISTEQKHHIEYRMLKGIQRDLAKQGITSSYARRCLSGLHQGKAWYVTYDWLHASNGECCGIPYVVVEGRSLVRHLGTDVVRTLVEHLKSQAG